jgi:hypothetical protein
MCPPGEQHAWPPDWQHPAPAPLPPITTQQPGCPAMLIIFLAPAGPATAQARPLAPQVAAWADLQQPALVVSQPVRTTQTWPFETNALVSSASVQLCGSVFATACGPATQHAHNMLSRVNMMKVSLV